MNESKECKAKNEGAINVSRFIDLLKENKDGLERMVVIALNTNGEVVVYESTPNSSFENLGMIEYGKQLYLNDLCRK